MKRNRNFLLCLLLLLGGCSSTFLYNQLDWLIPWWVDDYVDLSRDQKKDLKAQLLPLLEWHREEELRNYRDLLDSIAEELRSDVTPAMIQHWADELWQAYMRLEKKSLPLLFETGASFSTAQMQEFMESLYKEQDKLEDKYLERDGEEFVEESYDNMVDNLSDLLGRLQPSQKQRLELAAQQLQRFDAAWLEERRRWLDTLQGILLQRQPGWQQQVEQALDQRESNRSAAYSEGYESNQRLIFAAMADVLNSRTDKQRGRLEREIDGIREDLDTLIATAAEDPGREQAAPEQPASPGLLQ